MYGLTSDGDAPAIFKRHGDHGLPCIALLIQHGPTSSLWTLRLVNYLEKLLTPLPDQ